MKTKRKFFLLQVRSLSTTSVRKSRISDLEHDYMCNQNHVIFQWITLSRSELTTMSDNSNNVYFLCVSLICGPDLAITSALALLKPTVKEHVVMEVTNETQYFEITHEFPFFNDNLK